MLKKNKESALMSRELSQMKKDVDIDFKLEDCKFGNFDKNKYLTKNLLSDII